MSAEPDVKRAVVFIDGRNLFHSVRGAFGYGFPNVDSKVASAYPSSPAAPNRRGINKTDSFPIDPTTYDACIDPYDYRPKAQH